MPPRPPSNPETGGALRTSFEVVAGLAVRILCICALGAWPCASAFALDREQSLSHFHHTSWTIKDGAPADIWALAQTTDGYLWLGTGSGLYRFDGIRFERFQAPPGQQFRSNNITALMVMPSGELWIGFYFGGASVLKDGGLTHYAGREGLPSGTVFQFARDDDGTLWAATTGGLARFDGTRWQEIGEDWNYPEPSANWVFVDQRGTLWVSTGETLVFLRRGSRSFERTGEHAGIATLAEAADGRLWISDDKRGTRPLPGIAEARGKDAAAATNARTGPLQAKRMLFDREGSLWATDATRGGIFRVSYSERVDSARGVPIEDAADFFTQNDGLTANIAVPLLEDMEGNIWVGTNLGLNRFRHSNILVERAVPSTSPSGFALAAGEPGTIWVASNNALLRIGPHSAQVVIETLPETTCAWRDTDGTLWLGGPGGLQHMINGKLTGIALPAAVERADVQAMTSDRAGRLWVSFEHKGVFRLDRGVWTRFGNGGELSVLIANAAASDPLGRVWLGYSDGRLALIEGDSVRIFSAVDGLQIGSIATINADTANVLVGGEFGVAGFDGNRFSSLTTAHVEALSNISGIVEARGDVWLNGTPGIVRTSSTELRQALASGEHRLRYELLDFEDGLPGIAQQVSPIPSAIAGSDGRIWFATNHGVAWIDPARIARNTLAPPVSIRSLRAGDTSYPATSGMTLPVRTTNVEIDYTAPSLTVPERVRFRYKLDGVDEQWQDVDTRRTAYYTYLDPGQYRFQVTAANNDGVWNDTGASFDFIIPPTFFQTRWFLAACVAVAAGVLWLLYLLRLRRLAAQMHGRLEERLIERERIARELHDTFLQGVQGLILRFQAVANRIPENEPARPMMEQALERADQVLVEGRDRVKDLRASTETRHDLAQTFVAAGAELARDYPAQFRVVVEGTPRDLHPIVRDEVYHVGREALVNAFHHAQAREIETEIAYGRVELRLRVRDDGHGIDPAILEVGGRPGHWGLSGMRERTRKIGAHLDVWSRPGSGTEVELRVPAATAYQTGSRTRLRWLRRLLRTGN